MAKTERTIMREIPAGGVKQTDFVVEYRDGEGHWVSAAGGWNWGAVCRSSYPTEAGANTMATEIARLAEYATRVVKVVTHGD